ncbi:MAG: hypothetical protein DRP87_13750 [Spirochaetes bacterium]|nr:MAG: hypothetical protein DRP87_13750 [Spirochaetota bacterium]
MPSIDKIHSILELLRKYYKTGLTNKEISSALNIPPSTCYRILASLKKYDYIYQRKSDMRYFLGFAHLRFAESVIESVDAAAICLPYLEDLHRETEETVFFALYNGKQCVAMEVCGYINTRISVGRGEIMPMHCASSGKAVLAFLPEREKKRYIYESELKAYTKNTIIDPARLEENIKEIYRTGVAYNFQEFNNGINAMSTPIFDSQNRVIGALTVVGTSVDLDEQQMKEYSEQFLEASIEISNKLGAEFPPWIIENLKKQGSLVIK